MWALIMRFWPFALAAVLASALGIQTVRLSSEVTAHASTKLQYAQQLALQHSVYRERERTAQDELETLREDYQNLSDRLDRDASGAADSASRLRNELSAANRRAEREASAAGRALDENAQLTAELRDVVGMCAERHRVVAEEADRLRGSLTGLQGWAAMAQRACSP